MRIILKDKSKKSHGKQTPKKKKKSSELLESEKLPRRSSPRFKNNSEDSQTAEKTTPTQSPIQKTQSAVEPPAEKPTPTRSSLRKRKSSVELEQSQPGASQAAPSTEPSVEQSRPLESPAAPLTEEVVPKRRVAKRKLYTGPCPNVQLRNADDTLLDFEEEEEEDEELEQERDVEVEKENKENDNDVDVNDARTENETEAHQEKPKRKYVPRGPTRMTALGLTANKNGKEAVSFNNKDQPVGDPSVQLASVLGVLVRRNIPLKHKDWRLVPREAKDNIWAIIMQRFIVDDFYKDYYLGKMGSYLKEARSRKAGKILALDGLEEEERQMKLAELKPENDTVNEWEEFVAHVCSEGFRAKRLQMQQVREKYTTPHTLSRGGYARLEAKMQKQLNTKEDIDRVELWITGHKPKEGKEPNPGNMEALERIDRVAQEHGADVGSYVTDDFLSKALGDDKPGRLRGIGYGATKTKMVIKSHYKKIIKECKDSMSEMNARLALLEEKTSRCVCCHDGSHLNKASPISGNASNTHGFASSSRTVPQFANDSPVSRPRVEEALGKGKACRLLSWYNENEVVADAIIAETDPKMECHGVPIGFGAYKVTVTTSRVDDAHLYKPSGDLKRVIHAVGTYVTWSKDLIMPAI